MGGLFMGQSLAAPEAQAAPTTHKIGTFPLHDWWASSHKISEPLKVDGETLYTGDDGDSWGYLKTNGEPVSDVKQTLFGTPSTSPTSATNPSPSGGGWIATVAVDANVAGKREAAYGYSWAWNASSNITGALRTLGVTVPSGITNSNTIPVYRIKDGETQAQWTTVPVSSYFGQTGGNMYWSGGEVIQSTGQIFFSGGECAAMNNQFSMMIFDPNTGQYNFSGLIKPATPADNIFGTSDWSCGGTGYVSSDMALDANGNAYVVAVSNQRAPNFGITTTSSRSWLVRIVPSWDPQVDWTYELVTPISAGPGQNNVPVGADVGTVWGMAFYQGSLYAVRPDYNVSQINVMSGQAFNIPAGSRVARLERNIFDLASGQTAIVVQGTVYMDAGADGSVAGDPGLPGQQVALYQQVGDTYVYQGMRYTNEQGNYSFLVAGNGNYVVRLAQPAINGVNALQTYATGGGALNPVIAQCVGGNVTSPDGAPCVGAVAMPAADPALPAADNAPGSDTSTQPDAMTMYSVIKVTSAAEVVNADFGVTATGSFGDTAAGPGTMESGAPVHINGFAPQIWLGKDLGAYAGPATDNKAHNATDDGVYIDSYAGKLSLANTVLAGTKAYRLTADVSGPSASKGSVVAWTTEPGANTWVPAPAWTPTIVAGKAVGDYQFLSSGSLGAGGKTIQMRVNASTVAQDSPTNTGGGYQSAKGWTTPGEIEDYSFTVADAVYRPAAKTSGGRDTFTVAGAQITAGKDMNVGPGVGTGSGSPVSLNANTPQSWTVSSITIKETETGATIASPAFTISGGSASFSYTPAQGSDVIIEVAYAQDPDPAKSTLSLDKDSAQVGTPITATASVNDVNGEGLNGVVVTFGKKSSEITLSASTCTTEADGTCSVTLTSSVAKTYPEEISATVKVAAQDTKISGSPKSVSFTTGTLSYTSSTFQVTPAVEAGDKSAWRTADGVSAYTGVLTAKDESGNSLTSLSPADISFTASSSTVTVSSVTNNKDGTYSVSFTSKHASSTPTASVSYQNTQVGAAKPIPFKPGPADPSPECTDPTRPGTNLSASPTELGINDISNVTVLVTDSTCNPISNIAVTFSLDPGSRGVLTVIQATTDAEGKAYASLTDPMAETVKVRARITEGEVRGSPASVTFITGGFSWMSSSFTVTPEASLSDRTTWLVADGTSAYTGVLTAKDNGGNLLSSLSVGDIAFTANPGVKVSSVVNNQNGTYSVKFTSTVASAALTASVTYKNALVGAPKPIPFKAGPVVLNPDCADPERPGTKLWANPTQVGVGATSSITALLTDAWCNPISDSTVSFTLDPNTSAVLTVVRATTDGDGRAHATLTDAVAETVKVRARIPEGELNGSPASVRFTAGALSWVDSTFTVIPQANLADRRTWMVADGTSAYTGVLTAKDNGGNLLPNLTASDMEFTASNPAVTVSGVTNNKDGTYSVTYTSRIASASLTAAAGYQGDQVGTAKPIPFRSGPAVLGTVCTDGRSGTNLIVSPASLPVGGISTATALVTDASCNPIPDAVVTFWIDPGTSAVLTVIQATTDSEGKAYASLTDSLAESVLVHARIAEGELNGSPASVRFTTGGFSWMDSSFTVTPQASTSDRTTWLVADGVCAYTGVLTAKDNSGNLLSSLPESDIAFTASHADVSVSKVVNAGSGQYTVTFVSTTATATSTASVAYQGNPVGTAKPIPFKAGPPAPNPECTDPARPGTNLTVSPQNVKIPAGAKAVALVTDANCNPVDTPVEVTFSTNKSATVAPASAKTGVDGTAIAQVSDSVAETVDVRASIGGTELRGSPAQVTFMSGELSSVLSTFSVSPVANPADPTTWMTANGSSAYTGVLVAKDNSGAALTALSVSDIVFAASSTDVKVSSVVNEGSGRYAVTFTSKVASATPTARVTYLGEQVGTPLPIPFAAGPAVVNPNCGDPGRPGTNLGVNPASVAIPGTSTATAYITDADCNPVGAGVEVRFSVDGKATVSSATVVTDATGRAVTRVADTTVETVNVRAVIAQGELAGSPAKVSFMDTTAPRTPTIDTANAKEVSGTSEPGTTIQMTWPDGTVTETARAGDDGKWLVKTPADMESGTITVVAKDPSGNRSDPVSTTLDTVPPRLPTIDRANASQVSGTSETDTTILVTWPDGTLTSGQTGKDGKWSVVTPPGMKSGTIRVVAKDPAGNESASVSTTLDTDAPDSAVVNPSNGSAVTGTAEPGTRVRVTDKDGNVVPGCDKVVVDKDGNFVAVPSKPLKPGSSVTVTVIDTAGNSSEPVMVSIGNVGIVIAHPTRYPQESQVVTGTTFNPGEKVCLTVTNSTPVDVACQQVGKDGKVTFTFTAPRGFDAGTRLVTLTGETSGTVSASFVVLSIQVKTGGSVLTVPSVSGLVAGLLDL